MALQSQINRELSKSLTWGGRYHRLGLKRVLWFVTCWDSSNSHSNESHETKRRMGQAAKVHFQHLAALVFYINIKILDPENSKVATSYLLNSLLFFPVHGKLGSSHSQLFFSTLWFTDNCCCAELCMLVWALFFKKKYETWNYTDQKTKYLVQKVVCGRPILIVKLQELSDFHINMV